MQKLGGAVILMQQNLNRIEADAILNSITYLVGDSETIANLATVSARKPFDDEIIEFLNDVSRMLMTMPESKMYPDVITLGYWMRKSSTFKLKQRFMNEDGDIHVGRGVAFHIAPSNVPVNYAYSLVTGLLTGNANVVRIPSKDFPQVGIINKAFAETLEKYLNVKPYICLIRYGRDQAVNDLLSAMTDVRIIWGGDHTIEEIRKSPIGPRAGEIAFADRYSLAVIDSDTYLSMENKERVAEEFYNDTYLTDQNACTSPRVVVWMGSQKEKAKREFWSNEHKVAKSKYTFQSIMGINKLTNSYLMAVAQDRVKVQEHEDNFITRVQVPKIDSKLMEFKGNSGFFIEYDCDNVMDLKDICNNTHCQTLAYIGKKEALMPLLESGMKGIDRVVPVGQTMDFDFIWDGYNLVERLTRTIKFNV